MQIRPKFGAGRHSRFHEFVEGYCSLLPYMDISNKKKKSMIKLKNAIKMNEVYKGILGVNNSVENN